MANIANIHDRIALLVKEKASNKNTVFAQTLGVSEANIRGYIKGVVPKADILAKIVRTYEDVSSAWLLTGEGPMLKSGTPSPSEPTPKPKKSEKTSNTEGTAAFLSYIREQATAHAEAIKEKDAVIEQKNREIADLRCTIAGLEAEIRHHRLASTPAPPAHSPEPVEPPLSNAG